MVDHYTSNITSLHSKWDQQEIVPGIDEEGQVPFFKDPMVKGGEQMAV